ncbi:hypothetical protein HZC09_06540 [Candidatus Micrarchaeota archaeon]|nr:hypothetical protein [Candidatus Micrarchaeota archaeon]
MEGRTQRKELREYTTEDIKNADIHYDQRLGHGKQGEVFPCTVEFHDGTKRRMAVKIVPEAPTCVERRYANPEDVIKWNERMRELRAAKLPVPKISFARVVGEGLTREGQLFMQLIEPAKTAAVERWDGDILQFEGLRALRKEKHAKIIENIGINLAKLHNLGYSGGVEDYWRFIKHPKTGQITGIMLLDVGMLCKTAWFEEYSKQSIRGHLRNLTGDETKSLFLNAYLEEIKNEEMKAHALEKLKPYGG